MNKETNVLDDMMITEMEKLKNLRGMIKATLRQIEYEKKRNISYAKITNCDKENFRRIFKIYFAFQNLKDKDSIKLSLYTTIYVLWTDIDKIEKDTFLAASRNPKLCGGFGNVPETFEALDLVCKWVKLNALDEDEQIPYLIYDLDNIEDTEVNETNLSLLPKINDKIKKINKILATFPGDIQLMTLLYELIVLFHKLKNTGSESDTHLIKVIYGTNYYRNIYSAILLFWKFIQSNVPDIYRHPNYRYVVMNMYVLEKTDIQNKLMDRISRSTLKNIKGILPKKPENVNKLRNANLLKLL